MPEKTDNVFDLDAVSEVVFPVRVDGEVRKFDPFEMMKRLRHVPTNPGDPDFEDGMEQAREAFGFPRYDSGKPTVSTARMLALMAGLITFLDTEVPDLKKLLGETPNSPASSAKTSNESADCPSTTSSGSPS